MTTLQYIMRTLRQSTFIDPAKVNYGVTDGLEPPYVNVSEYRHELTYDTGGVALKEGTYKVTVIDKSQDSAEELAAQVDGVLNLNLSLTPNTIGSFQESYEVGQMAEKLYQFGVQIGYSFTENYRQS